MIPKGETAPAKDAPYAGPVRKVFFALSTGRCGTRYLAALLDLAENGTVLHEPPPGGEPINPVAYRWFVSDRQRFDAMKVDDFPDLREHAEIYRTIPTPVFGDCYNSFYPFAMPLYHFFRQRGISIRFIHLLRHPAACCSSILRAEGPFGKEFQRNFILRAPELIRSDVLAEKACDVWIGINKVIKHEMGRLEELEPGISRVVRIEDTRSLEYVLELFRWLGLNPPPESAIERVMSDASDEVRHSHQVSHDLLGVPPVTSEEMDIIRKRTAPYLEPYGYGPAVAGGSA